MKNSIIFLVMFFVALAANAQEFKFEKETVDYGKIKIGSDGARVFEFTNTGNAPLIINRVVPTCGCTVAKTPQKPILPGKKGEIKISYNTNIPGGFSKAITVYSNAKQERKTLKIKGYVER